MKKLLQTLGAITAIGLAALLPVAASAETFTSGTGSSIGVTNTAGCVTTKSSEVSVTNGVSVSIQGSGQYVTAHLDGSGVTSTVKGQVDGSFAINFSKYTDTFKSNTDFQGTQRSTQINQNSFGYNSISPQ